MADGRGTKSSGSASSGGGKTASLDDRVRMLILYGPESHLRSEHLRDLRASIEAKHGEVDVLHFDGASAMAAEVLDEARSLGLMQQYKIIVVEEAEEFLKRGEARRIMERYAENPAEGVTLVLRSAAWHPGKLDKKVEAVGRLLKCEAPEPPEAAAFCIERCKGHGGSLDRAAAHVLVERIGTSLARLDSEVARLSLMVDAGGVIDADLVREQIPLSREEKAWEVQEALLTGEAPRAMGKLIELMTVSRHDPVPLFYSITDLSRKIYAAGRLLREGQHERSIKNRARMWGSQSTADATVGLARRMAPPVAAQLMLESLRAVHRTRQSLGSPERSVEMLALRFLSAVPPR